MSNKKAPKRGHKTGKTRGYGYQTDGESYWIAQCYAQEMDAFLDEARAIADLVAALNTDLLRRNTVLAQGRRQWWHKVCADLGITYEDRWVYLNGRVSPAPAEGRSPETQE